MNEELIAKTPLGEIAVGIKSDPTIPASILSSGETM